MGKAALAWEVADFTLRRTWNPPASANGTGYFTGTIDFGYNNTATDNDWPRSTDGWRNCLYLSDQLDGEVDGKTDAECARSFEPFNLSFRFDKASGTLTLMQKWSCDGVDADHT